VALYDEVFFVTAIAVWNLLLQEGFGRGDWPSHTHHIPENFIEESEQFLSSYSKQIFQNLFKMPIFLENDVRETSVRTYTYC
jgi:hypothetical protein